MPEPTSNAPAAHTDERDDPTFKRHGPEPPENDSGPAAGSDEWGGEAQPPIHNVDPDEQVD